MRESDHTRHGFFAIPGDTSTTNLRQFDLQPGIANLRGEIRAPTQRELSESVTPQGVSGVRRRPSLPINRGHA